MKKVMITPQSFIQNKTLMSEALNLFKQMNFEVFSCDCKSKSIEYYVDKIKPEIIIVGLEKVNKKLLIYNPQIEYISKYGVGLDNIDQDELKNHNVRLGWSPGLNKRSVSELTLSFALGHFRNVFNSVNLMKNGVWKKNGGRLLSEMKIGIVGLGNIGLDFAKLLQPFGCEVIYNDLEKKAENFLNITYYEYNDLLAYCDIISFHVPSTNLTKNMYSKKEIEYTKKDAFIINTSRGDIIDFTEVIKAVESKKLSGFASDVFSQEPFDASLWKDQMNILLTPHIGGNAEEAILAMGRSALEHIRLHYLSMGDL